MSEFKEGDVVQLASGGPEMTVTEVQDDRVTCVWFDDANKFHELHFKDAQLTYAGEDRQAKALADAIRGAEAMAKRAEQEAMNPPERGYTIGLTSIGGPKNVSG